MKKIAVVVFILATIVLIASDNLSASMTYFIEKEHNDEIFIINGEVFKAKTYCFGNMEGDRVKFIEGSPYGACVSAKFFNLRTEESCDVWCE